MIRQQMLYSISAQQLRFLLEEICVVAKALAYDDGHRVITHQIDMHTMFTSHYLQMTLKVFPKIFEDVRKL